MPTFLTRDVPVTLTSRRDISRQAIGRIGPIRTLCFLLVVLLHSTLLFADDSSSRIDPVGIRGSLVICGGGELSEPIYERFVELAGGKSARLVLIPTAASDSSLTDLDKLRGPWLKRELMSVEVLHTRMQAEANRDEFVTPLKSATGVWFGGGQQSRIAESYVGTAVERELLALLQRGGVIGGTSAGAAVHSRLMITGGNPIAQTGMGFDFLPDAVVDQHFLQRNRKPRLTQVLKEHSRHVGFGIDEGTALIVQGRKLEVLGQNKVTVCLAASASRPPKEIEMVAKGIADLTALRRAARERTRPPFPPQQPQTPVVPNGSLLLGGGGGLTIDVMRKFIELAGGPDVPIVVLPTAVDRPDPQGGGERRLLEKAGAKNLIVLPANTLPDVESEVTLSALKQAKGIWFGGGRQWHFVDAYEGTKAIELFHDVLRRGGIIGGSSAGASIQSEYMVRGSPLGNLEMMAEGYEHGFGFLPGAAVDQHFTQRNRHGDMKALVTAYPQLLGIGLDESSALLIRGEIGEVLGKNSVYFFDRSTDSDDGSPIQVPAGKSFNLRTRKLLP